MGLVGRKQRLLEDIARLRRVERETPRSRDLVAVRVRLEDELGETVSQRLAARFLGVSHTALQRWIRGGDLPTVYTPSGKQEIPVVALLDLHERVSSERETGSRRRHVLEPTMSVQRARAQRLHPATLLTADHHVAAGHTTAERRALAYHRAVARRLTRATVNDALHLVWQWRDQGQLDDRYAEQWEEVLRKPVSDVKRVISEDSPFARDLRQNSPFAGVLSEPERRKILQEVR